MWRTTSCLQSLRIAASFKTRSIMCITTGSRVRLKNKPFKQDFMRLSALHGGFVMTKRNRIIVLLPLQDSFAATCSLFINTFQHFWVFAISPHHRTGYRDPLMRVWISLLAAEVSSKPRSAANFHVIANLTRLPRTGDNPPFFLRFSVSRRTTSWNKLPITWPGRPHWMVTSKRDPCFRATRRWERFGKAPFLNVVSLQSVTANEYGMLAVKLGGCCSFPPLRWSSTIATVELLVCFLYSFSNSFPCARSRDLDLRTGSKRSWFRFF